jgi:hypothetical protein
VLRFHPGQKPAAGRIERTEVTPIVQHRRKHTHYFVRLTVDSNGAPNHVGSAPETTLPATLTDENDMIVPCQIFTRPKIAAQLRLNAQHGKQIGSDASGRNDLSRLTGLGKARVAQSVGANFTITLRLTAQIEEISG